MNLKKNKLYFNSLILSSPGFISTVLSIFAIPVHLKFLGIENYGNYVFFHLVLSFSFLLNFGIPKSIIIASGLYPNSKGKIAFDGLKYALLIVITVIFIHIINSQYNFFSYSNFSINYITLGIIFSIIYLVFEGVLQSYKKFIEISFFNFLFYSLSLSLPSISLIYFKKLDINDLVFFSLSIKFLVIFFIIIIVLKNKLIIFSSDRSLIKIIKKNSLWLTLNSFLMQLYEMLDKYLIKLFIGNAALGIYSIPQQLTGKLSVVSRGFSAFLMPFLSAGKKRNDYNKTLDIFYCFIPIVIFLLLPTYPFILKIWLGSDYSNQILTLTKIFTLIAILSSNSHILITRFEADQKSKKNFKIELIFLPFFLILLLYLFNNFQSIIFISLAILLKELILNFLRLIYLKKNIVNIKKYLINLFLFNIILFFSFFNITLYIVFLLILILLNFKK